MIGLLALWAYLAACALGYVLVPRRRPFHDAREREAFERAHHAQRAWGALR